MQKLLLWCQRRGGGDSGAVAGERNDGGDWTVEVSRKEVQGEKANGLPYMDHDFRIVKGILKALGPRTLEAQRAAGHSSRVVSAAAQTQWPSLRGGQVGIGLHVRLLLAENLRALTLQLEPVFLWVVAVWKPNAEEARWDNFLESEPLEVGQVSLGQEALP